MPQWVYRPTDEEHEALRRAMALNPEYTSVAQYMREAVLRMIADHDRRPLYTEIGELIEELKDTKDKFLTLVIKHSEEES